MKDPVPWSPWRTVTAFGLVSLAVDVVSDGARPLGGPLLGQLGASALLVGLVTGGAEAAAQGLRLLFGPWADRTGNYWAFTLGGYALTVVCVPLLAFPAWAGAPALILACLLILADRFGKAIRSPSKTVLLAAVAKPVGRGRGFAVHKSLDLAGAFSGPLLVAGIVAATGLLWPAFAVLVVPGALAMVLLFWIRRRTPALGPATEQPGAAPIGPHAWTTSGLPGEFWLFAGASLLWSAGLVAFGVLSFHLTSTGTLPVALVPLVYAGAMAIGALGALSSGYLYDRVGAIVLLALPALIAAVPVLAFSDALAPALSGALVWGGAMGVQDSTVKALVADLVPGAKQGTAYGLFAAFEGAGSLAGGVLYGALYGTGPVLVAAVAVLQFLAFGLLIFTLRRTAAAGGCS